MSFIHNPSSGNNDHGHRVVRASSLLGYLAAKGLLDKISPSQLLTILNLGPVFSPSIIDQTAASADGDFGDTFNSALFAVSSEGEETYEAYVMADPFVVKKLRLAPGQQALVVNGRVRVDEKSIVH